MRLIFIFFLVFNMQLMISGCSVQPLKASTDNIDVLIDENLHFILLPAFAIEKPLILTQNVQIKYASKQYDFITRMEIDNNSFKLVGLTSMGIKLFSIDSIVDSYNFETSPLLGEELNLAYLLADMQLTYWPGNQLNTELQKNNAGIKINSQQRIVLHNDIPVIDIKFSNPHRWNKNILFRHLQRNYSVTINTLEMEKL